jgi:Na+:H+ antiporter
MSVNVLMGQILFLSGFVLLGLVIHRLVRLDLTLSCLSSGVIAGLLIPVFGIDTGVRANNIHDLVFYIILPILVFEAAWHIKPSVLKNWLPPILLLATVGVVISALIVAAITYYLINEPAGFPWQAALLTGAILAATDPIAVVAALKKLKASEELSTLIEGESLFNDATAVVIFGAMLSVAVHAATTADASADAQSAFFGVFITVFLGGLMVGAVVGLVGAILVLLLADESASSIVLLILSFVSFYLAEHIFHVSGILSVMNAAIVSRVLLKEHEQKFLGGVVNTWNWIGLLFNALIFVLMGLVITFDMFTEQWLAIAIAIGAALVARAFSVFSCGVLTRPMLRPLPLQWQYLLIWGGLRGAIAIVLVLSLPVDLPYWWTIQSMVFGVVLFTLLIQGTTMGPLIKRYQHLP